MKRALACALLVGCAVGTPPMHGMDGGHGRDAGRVDAHVAMDAGRDAGPEDAGTIVRDAGTDAPAPIDAGTDAPAPIDAGACAISIGDTPALDGTDDLADYPASQHIAPAITLAATDALAITWDVDYLYVTATSEAFLDASRPLHVYIEAGSALGTATAAMGKEYGGNTPWLPFSPTHVIAVRRQSSISGSAPYDGVYVPASTWMARTLALLEGTDVFASSDMRTLSVRVPWTALGICPAQLRLASHVVYGAPGSVMEWKDVAPATHTPWMTSTTGFYEIDLSADPDASLWTVR